MTKQITKRKRVGRYPDKIRNQAGLEYAISGSIVGVSRSMGIHINTLRMWHKDGKWDDLLAEVRASNTDRNIIQYDRLTKKALKAAEQGIDGLDLSTLRANDIKALVITGAASTDKSRLLQSLPTSITSTGKTMQNMIDRFERIERDYQAGRSRVVSVQEQEQ